MVNQTYKKWLPYIEADLKAAEVLYKSAVRKKTTSWYYFAPVIWHTHQVVEKSLKMIIVAKNIALLKIHDLPRLVELAQVLSDLPLEWKNLLSELNEYYMKRRYPDLPLIKSYPPSNQKQAAKFLTFSKQFFLWTKKYLSQQK